jgi:hypothetical protein
MLLLLLDCLFIALDVVDGGYTALCGKIVLRMGWLLYAQFNSI